jgi:hypothetical protein
MLTPLARTRDCRQVGSRPTHHSKWQHALSSMQRSGHVGTTVPWPGCRESHFRLIPIPSNPINHVQTLKGLSVAPRIKA